MMASASNDLLRDLVDMSCSFANRPFRSVAEGLGVCHHPIGGYRCTTYGEAVRWRLCGRAGLTAAGESDGWDEKISSPCLLRQESPALESKQKGERRADAIPVPCSSRRQPCRTLRAVWAPARRDQRTSPAPARRSHRACPSARVSFRGGEPARRRSRRVDTSPSAFPASSSRPSG